MNLGSAVSRALLLCIVGSLVGCSRGGETRDSVAAPERDAAIRDVSQDAKWRARIAAHLQKHRDNSAIYQVDLDRVGDQDPLPIPGGLAEGVHVWLPGPTHLGLQGTDVDPNTITNYRGFSAVAFMAGEVTGSDGVTYDQFHDIRVFRGFYRGEDRALNYGTFAFI